jgi:ParB-like chromosome segregation protein Spo0J
MTLHIQHLNIKLVKPYSNNAKLHPQEQIEQIKASILHVGFLDPISIDEDFYILEGHGRYEAAKQLGYNTIPTIQLFDLSKEQKMIYRLAHNKLTMNTGFDEHMLKLDLSELSTDEQSLTGFSTKELLYLLDEPLTIIEESNELEAEPEAEPQSIICPECGYSF